MLLGSGGTVDSEAIKSRMRRIICYYKQFYYSSYANTMRDKCKRDMCVSVVVFLSL